MNESLLIARIFSGLSRYDDLVPVIDRDIELGYDKDTGMVKVELYFRNDGEEIEFFMNAPNIHFETRWIIGCVSRPLMVFEEIEKVNSDDIEIPPRIELGVDEILILWHSVVQRLPDPPWHHTMFTDRIPFEFRYDDMVALSNLNNL